MRQYWIWVRERWASCCLSHTYSRFSCTNCVTRRTQWSKRLFPEHIGDRRSDTRSCGAWLLCLVEWFNQTSALNSFAQAICSNNLSIYLLFSSEFIAAVVKPEPLFWRNFTSLVFSFYKIGLFLIIWFFILLSIRCMQLRIVHRL